MKEVKRAIRLAKEMELEEVTEIYRDVESENGMYAAKTHEQMYEWVTSEKFPYRQHFVALEKRQIVAAITWEIYDHYRGMVVAKIKWINVRKDFRRKRIGIILIRRSFKKFNNSWQRRVVTIRVAPYAPFTKDYGRELAYWFQIALDTALGNKHGKAQITWLQNLFGQGRMGEYIVIKNLR